MSQAEQPQQDSRKIKRTICIGLGGTGKDVLMRIRRGIVDRHGDLTQMPAISFVHIDTDKNAISGLKTGNSYRGVDLTLRDAEQVAATMKPIDINNLSQSLQSQEDFDRQSPYAHIGRWFPPGLLKNLKAIEEGAKGIRPVGRLAFFHNYRKIKAAIETAEKRTTGHEAFLLKNKNNKFIVEPGLNVFVVGSLCGGTGSGMFIDIAYCLKHLYGNRGAQVFGFLIISPELYGNNPMMNANTYAALKELNYYASPATRFEVCYDPQNIEIVQETRPAYEYVYLISNQTSTDYRILQKSKLTNVIANKILLDFSGELAPALKEPRDNFLTHMISDDLHPRANVQRYLTFGLAQMYFPRDITVNVALNRIKIKLIKFWLFGEGQSPDVQVLLERFLLNWRSQTSGDNWLLLKLEEATQEGNKSFNQSMNSWRNKLESQIGETKTKDDRTALMTQVERSFREQFRQVQPGESESTRGIWLTNVQQASGKIIAKLKGDIDQYVAELLTPKSPDFSVNTARAFLEALLTFLNKNQRQIEEKIQSSGSMARLDDMERKWKDAKDTIDEQEEKKGITNLFNNRKNEQFQEEAKSVLGNISELIKSNFNLALVQQSLQIVKALQQHTQSLINTSSSFDNTLRNLQSVYTKNDEDLRDINADEMNGEAIFQSDDTDDCYQVLLPDKERRSQLVAVSTKITQQLGADDSLFSFLTNNSFVDENQLDKEINPTVDRLFGNRGANLVESVIKRFMQNYSSSERSVRLEQIIREAEPLLPLNTADPYFYNDPAKSVKIIGFKDTEQPEVRQFKNILTTDLGVPYHVFKPIQAQEEIWFLNEVAGFPLRIVSGLEQMRMQYQQQNSRETFLHNDYSVTFTDFIPPEAKSMERLQDIFYPCLALRLFTVNQRDRCYEYEYHDDLRGVIYTASLSFVWNDALEQLSLRKDMQMAVEGVLNEAIANITENPSLWDEEYLAKLRQFVAEVDDLTESNINYFHKATVIGTRATIESPAKEGVLTRFQKRIEAKLKDTKAFSASNTNVNQQLLRGNYNNGATAKNTPEIIEGDIVDDLPPARKKDLMAELRNLIEMKREGYLTEQQFENAKRELGL